MIDRRIMAVAAACLCTLLAACGGGGQPGKVASASAAQPGAAGEIDAIVALLEQGDTGAAKKRIKAGLKRDPMSAALMLLRDSISKKPEELLGTESYRYTVRSGDTMSALSQRFLGNRLKFYQLSRYNGIDVPASLRTGQVIKIPGRPAPVAPRMVERKPTTPAPAAGPAKPKPTPTIAAAPVRAASPAAAQQARSAGLAALNSGQPRQAVSLLSRAANLDPANPSIARDLARARRIAATVSAN